MRRPLVLIGLIGLAAMVGCRSKPPPPPKYFPVCLRLEAHDRLQWLRNSAHTLYVRVFPLTTPDGFVAAEQTALLSDPPPTVPGATGAPRALSLHPGTAVKLDIDDKPAPFIAVGIVAGYYNPLGQTKVLVNTAKVPAGSCFTVRFGEAGIEGVQEPSVEEVPAK